MLEDKVEKVQYLDKGFDKVNTNFVRIESSYGKYGSRFSSKSQLHKHLKEGCIDFVQLLLSVLPAPALLILIIEL